MQIVCKHQTKFENKLVRIFNFRRIATGFAWLKNLQVTLLLREIHTIAVGQLWIKAVEILMKICLIKT
jgi:hypothetical protein